MLQFVGVLMIGPMFRFLGVVATMLRCYCSLVFFASEFCIVFVEIYTTSIVVDLEDNSMERWNVRFVRNTVSILDTCVSMLIYVHQNKSQSESRCWPVLLSSSILSCFPSSTYIDIFGVSPNDLFI
jgi:hypothetical protein